MRIDLAFPTSTMIDAGRTQKTVDANQIREEATDQARLSVDHATIKSLKSKLDNVPEVRSEKVEALRQAIQEGQYSVTAEQVAGAMYAEFMSPASR